jgi:hypothetical protein
MQKSADPAGSDGLMLHVTANDQPLDILQQSLNAVAHDPYERQRTNTFFPMRLPNRFRIVDIVSLTNLTASASESCVNDIHRR